ncbi:alpha-(1-_3)-arabinofuranosyltransferase family protein [Frankia sp. R82]|uniref:alpha-(1->3)-arabinofuranosyltransferase domain-containing protein n=1 Tax=Frankia sp. R82 TaxID=2950553 RepID=UPI002044C2BF|nr:alpha-(1->3)-arabinofuranosyltransferase family protein [Frankia sp. R82]MCM3882648.1 alpha-(1->3)-arabinofuranosyltransferase family protein [Frankia sp. R82]
MSLTTSSGATGSPGGHGPDAHSAPADHADQTTDSTQTTDGALPADGSLPADGAASAGRRGLARRVWPSGRFWPSWPTVVLAALAYLPLLATAPGKIGADTKAYLYLDPGRMLRRAVSMWDPAIGMGTVTHQNIGYLYPQGLFYWVAQVVGLPDWVAQRLWTGSILFGAGAGVLFLLRSFRWPDRFAFVAALGYMLSPYVLEYEARISAILLPYAGLGWLIGITVRGLREAEPGRAGWRPTGWRFPAAFALVVTTIGSINASSLIFILFAPLLWVPFAVWGTREVRPGAAIGMCARAVLAICVTSAWWMAGLYVQAGYGLNVLAFTETIETVASSSQASEVLRGLGNWFFYGQDALGPWIGPATRYTQTLWLIVVSFMLPVLALVAASAIRWGQRGYFVTLILLGTTIAVGVYPYDDPSPWGRLFKDFAEGSTAGLALRSLPRAVPMVALGLSVLLAGGLAALEQRCAAGRAASGRAASRWRPAVPQVAFSAVVVLTVVNMLPLFQGQFVDRLLVRPENVPSYETELANALDAKGGDARVLELPGADFSHYRWGSTLDPVTEGLMDRPLVVRELIPYGEAGSVDLVRALDRRLQEGVLETAAIPDLARLIGAGDVVLRSNLAYERYRTPRPRTTWDLFTSKIPAGLGTPTTYGPPVAEDPGIPFTDEITLGTGTTVPDPPALADFPVSGTSATVRTASTSRPLLVSGNAEALVDAAASGLLAGPIAQHRAILYAPELAAHPQELRQALDDGADLLVSDTNRLRAERWTGVRENFGYVEQPGVAPLTRDPNDNRLDLFPGETTADETTMSLTAPGTPARVAAVTASNYGNTFSYAPWDRPTRGIDGDLATAWRVGAFTDPTGEQWQATLSTPTTTDHLRLVQPLTGPRNRWITRATLTFDGGSPVTVDLDPSSRTAAGQTITFPARTFRTLHIRVDGTNTGRQRTYDGVSAVGFAEVDIPGADGKALTADEVLRMPSDTLTAAGASSIGHRLALQMSRDRANPAEPFKSDTESVIARSFDLPTTRTFALTGTARVSAYAADAVIDQTLGRPSTLPVVTSSGRLPGAVADRASSAFDGDPATVWSPGIGDQAGSWIQVASPSPVTAQTVTMSMVADGRHSVPTRIGVIVDGRTVGSVTVPPVSDTSQRGGTRQVALSFPATTGSTWRFVVEDTRTVKSLDPISRSSLAMPVGIAEIGLPGLPGLPATGAGAASGTAAAPGGTTALLPAQLPGTCRYDLLSVDGQPIGVRVDGSSADAVNRLGLRVSTCGGAITLGPGQHVVRTGDGAGLGLDLDRLLFASDSGGGPWLGAGDTGAETDGQSVTAPQGAAEPQVSVQSTTATSYRATVTGASPGTPFWLVLGQSLSPGWHATVNGSDAGAPRLIDGYANGWRIAPTASTFTVTITWAPQRIVRYCLVLSAVTIVFFLALLVITTRRRQRRGLDTRPSRPDLPTLDPWQAETSGRVELRTALAAAVGAGALSTLLVSLPAGLVVACATMVALLVPRGRWLTRIGPAVCLGVSALYVLEVQDRHALPTNGDWVSSFGRVAMVSWLTVLLLAADQLVTVLQGRRRPAP